MLSSACTPDIQTIILGKNVCVYMRVIQTNTVFCFSCVMGRCLIHSQHPHEPSYKTVRIFDTPKCSINLILSLLLSGWFGPSERIVKIVPFSGIILA
jgi:hypothetical protein